MCIALPVVLPTGPRQLQPAQTLTCSCIISNSALDLWTRQGFGMPYNSAMSCAGNFPGHKSASESAGGPCLPEGALTARARKLSIASEKNTATHAPVQLSFRIEDLTLPDKAGGKVSFCTATSHCGSPDPLTPQQPGSICSLSLLQVSSAGATHAVCDTMLQAGRRARARAIGVIKASSDPSDSSVVGVALSIGHKFDPVSCWVLYMHGAARQGHTAAIHCAVGAANDLGACCW